MEKILSDVQLAEVDVRYYEILAADATRDKCHTLAYVWQQKAEEARKIMDSLKSHTVAQEMAEAEQEMQALESQMWDKYQNGRDKPSEEAIEEHPFCFVCENPACPECPPTEDEQKAIEEKMKSPGYREYPKPAMDFFPLNSNLEPVPCEDPECSCRTGYDPRTREF